MRSGRFGWPAGLAALLLWAGGVFAEVVVLRDGRRVSGDCRANEKEVTVKRGMLIQYVPRPLIVRVELDEAETREFEALKRKLEPTGADGLFKLAEWLDDHLQFEDAEAYYRKVIEKSPDHKRARKALGYRKVRREWKPDPARQVQRALMGFGPAAGKKLADLARTFQESGDTRGAEKAWRAVLVRDPENAEAIKGIRPLLADYEPKHKYRRPVDGKWIAVSGHDHQRHASMMNALDLARVGPDGKLSKGPKLEDWYAFGREVHAAAAGKVIALKDDSADNPIGQEGDFLEANYVCIDHGRGELTLYAHLKKGSVAVHKGQRVKAGDVLGLVGNSGSSGTPHLHFVLYDSDGISLPVKFEEKEEK